MTIVREEFDGVVVDLEATIVSNEVRHEQSRELVVDVRELENRIDDFSGSRTSTGSV